MGGEPLGGGVNFFVIERAGLARAKLHATSAGQAKRRVGLMRIGGENRPGRAFVHTGAAAVAIVGDGRGDVQLGQGAGGGKFAGDGERRKISSGGIQFGADESAKILLALGIRGAGPSRAHLGIKSVLADEGPCRDGEKPMGLGQRLEFPQGVVVVPVAIGDGENGRSPVAAQSVKEISGDHGETSPVNWQGEQDDFLGGKPVVMLPSWEQGAVEFGYRQPGAAANVAGHLAGIASRAEINERKGIA